LAIEPILEKKSIGIPILMLQSSIVKTPMAALSRPVCGVYRNTLILTLPGSPKGAVENLQAVLSVLQHACDLCRALPNAGEEFHKSLTFVSNALDSNLDTQVTTRSRVSPYPMLTYNEALAVLDANCPPLQISHVNLDNLQVGDIIAQEIVSPVNVPNVRTSMVDGYAVIAANGAGIFPVVSSLSAGTENSGTLLPGTICRISTGGPVPDGADAIVMVEDTLIVKESNNEELQVSITTAPKPGQHIRLIGSDISIGEVVLSTKTRISPLAAQIGILSSLDILTVKQQ
jgi:gephyrin